MQSNIGILRRMALYFSGFVLNVDEIPEKGNVLCAPSAIGSRKTLNAKSGFIWKQEIVTCS